MEAKLIKPEFLEELDDLEYLVELSEEMKEPRVKFGGGKSIEVKGDIDPLSGDPYTLEMWVPK